ncbi:hypothetical protein CC79DRAFT_1319804 [Sarocladium strictum]
MDHDIHWEQGSDDVLTVPKVEPVDDDDFDFNDLKQAPKSTDTAPNASEEGVQKKRPRGRPRKHPLTPAVSTNKVTKGRSKTGCITCRKRKKKCDEAKPRCMNCEKNAVVCEGYHEKQLWKSGRERAEEDRMRKESLPSITMQPLFHGVETLEDKITWKHYVNHFSNVLTVEGEAKNAFKDIMLQLALQHQGLMHSILAVSSKHMDFAAPYAAKVLQGHPTTSREALEERAAYHHEQAMNRMWEDMSKAQEPSQGDDSQNKTVLSAQYGQILCLLLQTRAEGNPRGEHRLHLQAYQRLMQQYPPEDSAFHMFISEFFQYHIYADDLFWYPEAGVPRLASEDWESTFAIHPPRLVGVADGLFRHMSQITTMRNTIRANMAGCVEPLVDYTSLYRAAEIDAAICEWQPTWPAGDSRDRVTLLYKQMMWVYLFRTIYPPCAPVARRSTFSTLPPMTASMTPSRRASITSSICSSASAPAMVASAAMNGMHWTNSCPPTRTPSRTNSMHEPSSSSSSLHTAHDNESIRTSSPPPSRRPAHQDRRITVAVEESLAILETFTPSDPVQTLLLIPCVVIGTSCFEPAQQERIRNAVKAVKGYTGLRNCDRALEILEKIWQLMEAGDWIAVWDWQGVARRMGIDFLCA